MSIKINIPLRPIGKQRARRSRNGGMFTPEKTRTWEELAYYHARTQYNDTPITGPILVVVIAKFKAKRTGPHTAKPDLDNILKCLDAFNGLLWKDDSQIYAIEGRKMNSDKDELILMVEEYNGQSN